MYDEGMIAGILLLWYILTAGSLVYVAYDFTTNTPMLGVMKLAWFLILIYTGPVGLFLYLTSCRQPLPGTHDAFIKPHWKQAVGSMMHCIAGDATGIILAAAIVFSFGLPNGIDLIVEYAAAFVVGLLVFQALFMLNMFGNYWTAVRKTFFAEFVSMNMVMVGMFPTMLLLMHERPNADDPLQPTFWGVMSVATMVSMITAYPINSWMVRRGIKHGMMSAPNPSKSKTSAASSRQDLPAMPMDMPDKKAAQALKVEHHQHEKGSHHHHGMDTEASPSDHQMHESHAMDHSMVKHSSEQGSHAEHSGHDSMKLPMEPHAAHREHGEHRGHESHSGHEGHAMATLSADTQWVVGIATLAALLAAVALTSFLVPVKFTL